MDFLGFLFPSNELSFKQITGKIEEVSYHLYSCQSVISFIKDEQLARTVARTVRLCAILIKTYSLSYEL